MWNDIETTNDLLNFNITAEVAAELIKESEGSPLSIGISGNWGVGKSSLVKMIGKSLAVEENSDKYAYIEFNAWLYQGYEDARIALLQTVSEKLLSLSVKNKTALKKAQEFAKRVNWLKVGKKLTPTLARAALGFSLGGPLGAFVGAASSFINNKTTPSPEDWEKLCSAYKALSQDTLEILEDKEEENSITQEIQAVRNSFQDTLKELNITLIILVDDLDRCLPDTAISTLEAMRLLLFMENAAFVIAADEKMIRSAVRSHFGKENISDDLVTSYFDKLIQVPLKVPRLGINEVKAYIILLFCELEVRNSKFSQATFERVKTNLLVKVRESWNGVISAQSIVEIFQSEGLEEFDFINVADQIACTMTTASQIAGNPRLIKRFLNQIRIRQKVAKVRGMTISLNCLVKIQLFERISSQAAFDFLYSQTYESESGSPEFVSEIENAISKGEDYHSPDNSWDSSTYYEWLKISPRLSEIDLRPYLHLTKEESGSLAAYDELSVEAQEILAALLEAAEIDEDLQEGLRLIGIDESSKIFDRLYRRASSEQFPLSSIKSLINLPLAFSQHEEKFILILNEIPANKRSAPLMPTLGRFSWCKNLLIEWSKDDNTPKKVQGAIKNILEDE